MYDPLKYMERLFQQGMPMWQCYRAWKEYKKQMTMESERKDIQTELVEVLDKITDIIDGSTMYDTMGMVVRFPLAETYSAMDRGKQDNLYVKAKERLEALKADERLTYPTANVQVNAPLALVQCTLAGQINLLESLLGLALSTFPLDKS